MISEIKRNYNQLLALIIKEFRLKYRYKYKLISSYVSPIMSFIIPFLVFQKIFEASSEGSFGIWTPNNYIIFILTGMFVSLILEFVAIYGKSFLQEKYFKTLSGIFMSPINLSLIFFSKLITELIVFSIPLILIFAVCFLIAGVSLISMFFVIVIFLSGCILLSSLGLAIGSFRISREGNYTILHVFISFFFIFSCYKYPKEFFPAYLYPLISISPFYYYWDLIRYILVYDFNYVFLNMGFFLHFIVVVSSTIIAPILSLNFFNYVFKKYGISGY